MTVHTITSHTLDGSEVWGPYTADTGSYWIRVRINTPAHSNPDYLCMFLEPAELLIERRTGGGEWEEYGWANIYGDDYESPGNGRDSFAYAEYAVCIKEDGYEYRVTATTTYSQTIFGQVEFDTTTALPTIDTTGSNIDVVDAWYASYFGGGGHGTAPVIEYTTPYIDKATDNPGIVVLSPEQHPLAIYPGQSLLLGGLLHTGDYKEVRWGLDGSPLSRVARGASNGTISAPIYVQPGLPDERNIIHVDYFPDDVAGFLAGETPPEIREVAPAAHSHVAILVVNHLDQADPVNSTYENSQFYEYDRVEPNYDGETLARTGDIATDPGQLVVACGLSMSVYDEFKTTYDPPAGSSALYDLQFDWSEGGNDSWSVGVCYRAASGGSTTTSGSLFVTQANATSPRDYASTAVALSETLYCHMVAVETPADPNDLPDADQIRAETDGFDDPDGIYVYQKRGPDADGTVRFDDFTDDTITEASDITLCHAWDNEAGCVYYNLTTRQAIYHVAVADPGDTSDYPDDVQIKAGTDGFDAPALDIQVITYPYVSGTEDWEDFTGGSPGTDYLLCYVTGDEDPVYYQLSTTSQANIDGAITIQISMDGTIKGMGAIQGSTTMTVTPSGSAGAHGVLAGLVSMQFTLSGFMRATANIAGTISIVFNAVATYVGAVVKTSGLGGFLANLGRFLNR